MFTLTLLILSKAPWSTILNLLMMIINYKSGIGVLDRGKGVSLMFPTQYNWWGDECSLHGSERCHEFSSCLYSHITNTKVQSR